MAVACNGDKDEESVSLCVTSCIVYFFVFCIFSESNTARAARAAQRRTDDSVRTDAG